MQYNNFHVGKNLNKCKKALRANSLIKKCAFEGCGKLYETNSKARRYCGDFCYSANQKLKDKQRRETNRVKAEVFCLWCHSLITQRISRKVKYCGNLHCGSSYRTLQNRIHNLYSFDALGLENELCRLKELGKNYTFSKPHQKLNTFYELQGEPKKC